MRFSMLFFLVMGFLVSNASAQEAQPTLGGYALGMSVDEARALAPNADWPGAAHSPFEVQVDIPLAGQGFSLDLIFAGGALGYLSIERALPVVRDPLECLRTLDDIVADLETQLGSFDAPLSPDREGSVSSALEPTRTLLGSEIRRYQGEGGAYSGVALRGGLQNIEARVLVLPVRGRWECLFSLKMQTLHVSLPRAAAPEDGMPRLQNTTWLERPTRADLVRVYPRLASRIGLPGDVTLDCLVEPDGLLSCEAVSESPEGWGFDAAALNVSRQIRIGPQTRDGVVTAGGRVRVPIRFRTD